MFGKHEHQEYDSGSYGQEQEQTQERAAPGTARLVPLMLVRPAFVIHVGEDREEESNEPAR